MDNRIYIDGLQITNSVEKDNIIEIEGHCCHFNTVNLNNEIVNKQSFNTFFDMYHSGKLTPKLNWNHSTDYIGGITAIEALEDGLYINAFVDRNIKIVDEMIAPNILNGVLSQFSTEGYIQDGYKGVVEHDDGSYYVKDFLLTDVAIVAHPADPNAKFSVRNYIEQLKSVKEEVAKSKWYIL